MIFSCREIFFGGDFVLIQDLSENSQPRKRYARNLNFGFYADSTDIVLRGYAASQKSLSHIATTTEEILVNKPVQKQWSVPEVTYRFKMAMEPHQLCCQDLISHFGSVYLLQVSKNDDEECCF